MSREFRHIIRVADTDLEGTKKVAYALADIKGMGIRLAKVVVERAGLDPETRLGFLSEAGIKKITEIVENPKKHGVPAWLLNRSKDRESGRDRHLIGPDLFLQVKADIGQMGRIKSLRGLRHARGLKVRGQRTRTTGRKKKAVVVKKRRRTS